MTFAVREMGGKPNFFVNITGTVLNFNLAAAVGNPTYPCDVTCTISSSGLVGSQNPGIPAFAFGQFPAGSNLIVQNNGQILGAPGAGAAYPNTGSPGGAAIYANYPGQAMVWYHNSGSLVAGGGGGGGSGGIGGTGGQGGQGYYTYRTQQGPVYSYQFYDVRVDASTGQYSWYWGGSAPLTTTGATDTMSFSDGWNYVRDALAYTETQTNNTGGSNKDGSGSTVTTTVAYHYNIIRYFDTGVFTTGGAGGQGGAGGVGCIGVGYGSPGGSGGGGQGGGPGAAGGTNAGPGGIGGTGGAGGDGGFWGTPGAPGAQGFVGNQGPAGNNGAGFGGAAGATGQVGGAAGYSFVLSNANLILINNGGTLYGPFV